MTTIGQVDHVLLLLRERLARGEGKRAGSRDRTDRAGATGARPLERVRALAALDGMAEDDVRRAVVQGVLADRFGDAVANDAAFQSMVDDVARIIAATPEGQALIEAAVAELRRQG